MKKVKKGKLGVFPDYVEPEKNYDLKPYESLSQDMKKHQ